MPVMIWRECCFKTFSASLDNYFKENENKVTVGIPFKDRLDILSNTILSVINQTQKPNEIILVDDSENPTDLRNLPQYQSLFQLMDNYNIKWNVTFGRKLGQHHSHQIIQQNATYPLIWRIDSDEIAESNVLKTLLVHMSDPKVGAVAGLVPIDCPAPPLPSDASNVITNLNLPNIQWFSHPTYEFKDVEHLTSSYLYRKGIANFDLNLSKAAFREETLHTYEIKKKGYILRVDPMAITWHFRASDRHSNQEDWNKDDMYFQEKLRNWGVHGETSKIAVLDCGKGDHVVFKSLIPELKNKYKKLTIACCFPDVFHDVEGIELISIADANRILGQTDTHNIYRHMIDLNHKGQLRDAYKSLYLN